MSEIQIMVIPEYENIVLAINNTRYQSFLSFTPEHFIGYQL